MRKFYYILLFVSTSILAQNKTEANQKIHEGVTLHDAGKYVEAIAKYDEALVLDKNNLLALCEKAMTLESMKKYDEAIDLCKYIIKRYPKEENRTAYITYGNALDHSGNATAALKIFDEGIKKYPDYFLLYFNKGITLVNTKQNEKAVEAFKTATILNPNHASSFNALGVLNFSNRIASILASSRYLVLDNETSRAKANLEAIIILMGKGVSQQDDKSISLSIDEGLLKNVAKSKKKENDFSNVDLSLSMAAALDYSEENKDKTEIQKFAEKFATMCGVMAETQKGNKGYYWEYLAPYFIEMNKKGFVETFANIMYTSSNNPEALDYIDKNLDRVEEFYDWSNSYSWE